MSTLDSVSVQDVVNSGLVERSLGQESAQRERTMDVIALIGTGRGEDLRKLIASKTGRRREPHSPNIHQTNKETRLMITKKVTESNALGAAISQHRGANFEQDFSAKFGSDVYKKFIEAFKNRDKLSRSNSLFDYVNNFDKCDRGYVMIILNNLIAQSERDKNG